jgi:DnaJ domain
MSVCACGRSTNDGQAVCERCAALALFGLTRAATPTEIKDAYRVLAKVWHPDRFQGDEDLRRKAEEKLKEINSAYQLLSTTTAHEPYSEPARPASRPEEYQRPAAPPSESAPYQRPGTRPVDASYRAKRPARKKLLAIAAAILVAGGIWMAVRHVRPLASEFGTAAVTGGAATAETASHAKNGSPAQRIEKSAVVAGAVGQGSKKQTPNQATKDPGAPTGETGTHTRASTRQSDGASLVVYPDEDPQVPYFTVGSTKEDVIRIQGPPTKVAGSTFVYGLSEVYFRNGRVESWRMVPGSPLKAKMPE